MTTAPPFNGAWDMPDWDTSRPTPNRKGRKALAKGHRYYQIAIRLQPEGDVVAFCDAVAKALGWTLVPTGDLHTKKSLAIVYFCVHKNPQKALSACAFRLDRAVLKAGLAVARISYDVVEASEVAT